MRCPQCGTENPRAARFCLECGGALVQSCPQCSTALPPEAKFCYVCGHRVDELSAATPEAALTGLVQRLQRLVPREYAERLLSTRGQVGLERRMVTILFSDVKGSTAIAGGLDPLHKMMIDIMTTGNSELCCKMLFEQIPYI